jgi:hypothetical protein
MRAVRDDDPARRRWGWVAVFATLYFGAHQLLDFYANMPAALFAFAIPIAYLDATASSRSSIRLPRLGRVSSRIPATLGASAVVVAVIFLGWSEQHAMSFQSAVNAANDGDWEAAYERAGALEALDPGVPPYRLVRALGAGWTGDHATAATVLEPLAEDEDVPVIWLDAAIARLESGDPTSAAGDLSRAMRLGYQDAGVSVPAGELYLRIGDEAEARRAFSAALLSAPDIAADPFWIHGDVAALWPHVLDGALNALEDTTNGAETAHMIATLSGLDARATTYVARIDDPAHRTLASLGQVAWSGDEAARSELERLALDRPLDTYGLDWAARVASHMGDPEQARRFQALAIGAGGSGYAGALRIAAGEATPVAGGGTYGVWRFYGHYGYRRPTPWDLVLGGVPRVVIER